MSSIALKIALHGLMALVPTTDQNGGNHMTALLVDARMPHNLEGASEAHPRLEFLAVKTGDCIKAKCTVSGNQCICGEAALVGKHISLEFQPDPSSKAQQLNNTSPINTLPSNLLARMEFPFKTVKTCSLSTREDGGETNVHAIGFRKLHDPSQKDETSRALAQRVIAEITVLDGDVRLHISDFNGANDHVIVLLAESTGYKIDLSNQPDLPLDREEDPCDDSVRPSLNPR